MFQVHTLPGSCDLHSFPSCTGFSSLLFVIVNFCWDQLLLFFFFIFPLQYIIIPTHPYIDQGGIGLLLAQEYSPSVILWVGLGSCLASINTWFLCPLFVVHFLYQEENQWLCFEISFKSRVISIQHLIPERCFVTLATELIGHREFQIFFVLQPWSPI